MVPLTRRPAVRAALQFGAGNALALLVSVYWTLRLPKMLGVERFADWRLFLLYASFVGVLHAGALDALLFRWSRRRAADVTPAVMSVVLALVVWHALLLGAWLAIEPALSLPEHGRTLGRALLVWAGVWNVATALQYALQANRRFLACAVFSTLHAVLFGATVALGLEQRVAPAWSYIAAAAAAMLLTLAPVVLRGGDARWSIADGARIVWRAIPVGFAILVLNLLLIVLSNADRLAASWWLTKSAFGRYAFAASLLAFANNLTSVATRFLVPYMTGWIRAGGGLFARRFSLLSHLSLAAWWALVAGGLVVAHGIAYYLPAYRGALPVAGVMLVGFAFGAPAQVLQLNYARIVGRTGDNVRTSLAALGAGAVLLTIAGMLGALVWLAVAGAVMQAIWWALGCAYVLPTSPAMTRAHAAYAAIVVGTAAAATLALRLGPVWEGAFVVLAGGASVVLLLRLGRRLRHGH